MKKRKLKGRDPMACILLATDYFKPKTIQNKKKYNRKRDKKVRNSDLFNLLFDKDFNYYSLSKSSSSSPSSLSANLIFLKSTKPLLPTDINLEPQ